MSDTVQTIEEPDQAPPAGLETHPENNDNQTSQAKTDDEKPKVDENSNTTNDNTELTNETSAADSIAEAVQPQSDQQTSEPVTPRPASAQKRSSSRPSSATGQEQKASRPGSAVSNRSATSQRAPSASPRPTSGSMSRASPRPTSASQQAPSAAERPSSTAERSPSTSERPPSATHRPPSATQRPDSANKDQKSEDVVEQQEQAVEQAAPSNPEDKEADKPEEPPKDEVLAPKTPAFSERSQSAQEEPEAPMAMSIDPVTEPPINNSEPAQEPTEKPQEEAQEKNQETKEPQQETNQTGNPVVAGTPVLVQENTEPSTGATESSQSTDKASADNTEKAKKEKKAAPKLSSEELEALVKELMAHLKAMEAYDNAETLQILKRLSRLYFDYKTKRDVIVKILMENDFSGFASKLLVLYNKIGIFKSDDVWFPAYYTLNSIWNYTDASRDLGKALADKGIIQLMIANITHKPYLENMDSKLSHRKNPLISPTKKKVIRKVGPRPVTSLNNVNYVIKSSLSILQNISQVPEAKPIFLENKAMDAVKPFSTSENDFFKATSIMILTSIASEEENAVLEDTGAIPFMVKGIKQALNTKNRRYRGFNPVEFSDCLSRLAVNDANKMKIIGEGALPLLTELLKGPDAMEQNSAARCLWNLSFDDNVKTQIIEEPGCVAELETLSSSENVLVRKAAKGTLWKLRGEQEHQQKNENQEEIKDHIMISYNWAHQEMIIKIAERLKADGYKVWIDVDQMGGSTLGAMAEAVEKAAVVIICMSEKYKISPNCRTEGEYTFQLRKPIVPILMQRKYRPDGWLGMLLGAKLFTDFSKHNFDKAYGMLIKELKGRGHKNTQAGDQQTETSVQQTLRPQTASSPPRTVPKIQGWSNDQVKQWLTDNELQSCSEKFEDIDGKMLLALLQIRQEAPEYFYQTLEKKFQLEILDILRFVNALDSLS